MQPFEKAKLVLTEFRCDHCGVKIQAEGITLLAQKNRIYECAVACLCCGAELGPWDVFNRPVQPISASECQQVKQFLKNWDGLFDGWRRTGE
jgi:hypothetical protein